MQTTLNKIKNCNPCPSGWRKLLSNLGKLGPDDEPLSFATIIRSNGLKDAVWCLRLLEDQNRIAWFALLCALEVKYSMSHKHSVRAVEVAESFLKGSASRKSLEKAAGRSATVADKFWGLSDEKMGPAWAAWGAAMAVLGLKHEVGDVVNGAMIASNGAAVVVGEQVIGNIFLKLFG